MGFFSAIFTTKIARTTTMLIQIFTPAFAVFDSKVRSCFSIFELHNDTYFIGYMMGAMVYAFEINNIKDEYDQKIVLQMFFDNYFGKNSIGKIIGDNGQNNPSNPIFLEAQILGYNEISMGLKKNNDNITVSLIKYINEKYSDDLYKHPDIDLG